MFGERGLKINLKGLNVSCHSVDEMFLKSYWKVSFSFHWKVSFLPVVSPDCIDFQFEQFWYELQTIILRINFSLGIIMNFSKTFPVCFLKILFMHWECSSTCLESKCYVHTLLDLVLKIGTFYNHTLLDNANGPLGNKKLIFR